MAQNLQSAVEVWFASIGTAPDYKTMHYWEGAGQSEFDINFSGGYISSEHVRAFIRNDTTGVSTPVAVTFLTSSRVSVPSPVPVGYTICIYRDTPKNAPLALFIDGAIMNAVNFDRNAKQSVFAVAELLDRFDVTNSMAEDAIMRASDAKLAAESAAADAASAESKVATAQSAASAAEASAQSAAALAGTANTNASNALSVANGIDAKATQALSNSSLAVATAQGAETVANAIDAKATNALSQASAAVATANSADAKAQEALENGGDAVLDVKWLSKRTPMRTGYTASDGQTLPRALYPAALAAIQAGLVPVCSDVEWLADPSKRGCFTLGDGSTTFRVPDYNGVQSGSYGPVYLGGGGTGGTILRDRIQNFTGSFKFDTNNVYAANSGVFKRTTGAARSWLGSQESVSSQLIELDLASQVRVGDTTRPITVEGCLAVKLFGAVQNTGSADAAVLATAVAALAAQVSALATSGVDLAAQVSALATSGVDLASRVSALEQRKTTCLVNATGTGAPHETVSAVLPASVAKNTSYTLANPFGVNTPVDCVAEIFVNGRWSSVDGIYNQPNGIGIGAFYIQGVGIVLQTGGYGLMINSNLSLSGHGWGGGEVVNPVPCRVFVSRKDY